MNIKKKIFALLILIAASGVVFAQNEPSINGVTKADIIFQDAKGIAIHGYDPVAYFTKGKPVIGKEQFEYKYMGATWRFESVESKEAFAKEPERYLPEYGGYCAFGMSRGYAVPTEADAWTVLDGKLYLNFNQDVRREWNKDKPGYIARANTNWPKIPKKVVN